MQSFNDFPRPIIRLAGAYIFTHTASGKFYIGSTNNLAGRRSRHLTDLRYNRHPNLRFQRLYNQDPALESFFVITEDREEAYDREQELIDIHWGDENLLNMTKDVRAAFRHPSEESKLKHRLAITGLKRSDLTKERIRQAKLGVPRSDELKKKVSLANTGRIRSVETRLMMSQMRKGKAMPPRTQEHTDKIRVAKAGFKHSAESIAKIKSSSPTAKSVSINGVIYPSVAEAVRQIGRSHRSIRDRIASDKYSNWFYIN